MNKRGWLFQSIVMVVVMMVVSSSAFCGQKARRIMVYGDSNTFGWCTGEAGLVDRFPEAIAWPGRMRDALGEGYDVIVEGLGGRTTNLDGPEPTGSGTVRGVGMNGAGYLPAALSSHMPLDLVIIMLGTNDCRAEFDRDAEAIAAGIIELACIVRQGEWQSRTGFSVPEVMVIAPPGVNCTSGMTAVLFAGALPKTLALPNLLRPRAECVGAHFFDAATVVPFAEQPDEVHLTPANHAALGTAVAERVREIFREP